MTAQEFVYWLKGYLDACPGCYPTQEQMKFIREHLRAVVKS